MANKELSETKPMVAIRKIALAYPEVEEGDSCVNRAFKARKKSFLFMGMNETSYNLRLKLSDSLDELEKLSAKQPDNYKVGVHGWVQIILPHTKSVERRKMRKWIDESFRLLAPKGLLTAGATAKKQSRAKKKVAKRSAKKKS